MNIIQIIDAFLISVIVSYLITPFIRTIAVRTGYLDHPKDNKVHAHPTPLLGGLSIFIAFVIALLPKEQVILAHTVRALLLGASILLLIGLIDDRMGMMPNFKLLGQFLAAMVVIKAGIRIGFVNNYYISVALTYLWIIGLTNAINLSDNMNGLSAGIAAISAVFFGVIAYIDGQPVVSAISFALAGSTLGFLRYNFPKASIFMGDAGSLVLGYVLAVIAIMGKWTACVWTTSLMVPLLVLGYPIFDTALVSIVRILEGRSIFQGGKDHSSHRIALTGFKRHRTVLLIYGICFILGMAAVAVTKTHWHIGMALGIGIFILMVIFGIRLSLIDTKQFGRKKALNGD